MMFGLDSAASSLRIIASIEKSVGFLIALAGCCSWLAVPIIILFQLQSLYSRVNSVLPSRTRVLYYIVAGTQPRTEQRYDGRVGPCRGCAYYTRGTAVYATAAAVSRCCRNAVMSREDCSRRRVQRKTTREGSANDTPFKCYTYRCVRGATVNSDSGGESENCKTVQNCSNIIAIAAK